MCSLEEAREFLKKYGESRKFDMFYTIEEDNKRVVATGHFEFTKVIDDGVCIRINVYEDDSVEFIAMFDKLPASNYTKQLVEKYNSESNFFTAGVTPKTFFYLSYGFTITKNLVADLDKCFTEMSKLVDNEIIQKICHITH